jgi:hypothetical protein
MKKNTLKYLFLGLLLTSWAHAIEVGSKAPAFTLTDSTGATHSLSDFEGKFVVLEWTNHQCPFVVKHYKGGHMQALQKSMTDEGVVWLQIISSAEGKQGYVTPEEAESLRKSKEMHSTAMLFDPSGEVGRSYEARVTPHMYLINPEGELVYQGAIDSIRSTRVDDVERAENYLVSAYKGILAGQPVVNATTVPYGCSIKY